MEELQLRLSRRELEETEGGAEGAAAAGQPSSDRASRVLGRLVRTMQLAHNCANGSTGADKTGEVMMPKCSGLRRTLIGLALLTFTAAPTWAEDMVGKVSIETRSAALGVGVTQGNGVLEYQGQEYPFTVTGFSIGEVGATKVVARGEVYNLHRVEDFAGMFVAATAGATIGGGAGVAVMKNRHGVDMVWTSTNQGFSFSLAPSGLNVKFAEPSQQGAPRKSAPERQPSATPRPAQ